ncbi:MULTISPECIES: PIG-L deacetylase family protein [unclassified Thiomonas]|uniref:PIG-L deacetylase family protein n=1 Tax=unclassified Thiomonas TaxID=2625466 RepID=UPI001562B28D|nr:MULTISPECIES: PIG-L family deacetylase [unclassified Thiomonas]
MPPKPFPLEAIEHALVFIPHPDDEALGCGGLLRRLVDAGCNVEIVLVSDGCGGPNHPDNLSAERLPEFARSIRILGVEKYEAWLLPDGCLDQVPDLNERINARIKTSAPDLIIAPWPGDLHPDHAAIGHAVASSPAADRCSVAWFEIWSPLPASHVLDITDLMDVKLQALKAHETALRFGNYLEAMMGLSAYRGINLPYRGAANYAEAYLLRAPPDLPRSRRAPRGG